MIEKGYIHIYTGNGKGKTTAALGLCFRAAGCGIKSAFIQFMKGQETGELAAAKMTGSMITIEQYGSPKLLTDNNPAIFEEHKSEALKGYARAVDLTRGDEFRIIVLDEILNLLNFKLIELPAIIKLIKAKPEHMELVLTGRGAPEELVRLADLVTEMKEVKHYYMSGVKARKGIEF
ncbi:MAG TPA: cob(I)yrinic acid a,c-diamide adenosyltransferase [Spirochaetota bacterium]|nr:cob(I)yrinic acid a,c-diamide adenosyltransferase [Spirochaetota bacterium]HPJ41743.1 cob(I)yrinic acid a,c-diamide adenosyltransferase [Spirochaetota bacterium]HPR36654.1 cob(I)yrinic acid a,c-diamide adenosyltransferase [Spirochaetota bacterium]HRX47719.1 cob(I)yrinic acid a,c-diamide adenosyltransferase [Spirochaetota bacterium]